MRTHVRAVVVGGGAVGAGIAYALAKAGWTDTVLLERDELTSGSTWHAAGLLPLFNMGYATSHIHDHSVKLYKTLEAETGLNAGFSVVGNLRMAQTRGADGRVPALRLDRRDRRHPLRVADPGRDPRRAGRWSAPRTSRARSSTRPTATSTPPTSPRRWPRARGSAASRSCARRRSTATPGPARSGSSRGRDHGRPRRQPRADRRDLRDPRRACRHRHRQPRPAHRPAPRHQDPGDPGRAPVHRHRARPGARRVPQDATPSTRCCATPTRSWYVREERGGWILGPYEHGAPARFEYARPRQLPRRPLPARPRADRGGVPVDDPPHPVVGERRPQGRLQRPDLLHPRRQPAGRPGAGPAQPVAGRGLLLRHHRRRRHRPLPRADDDGGRGRDRHGLARPQALRRLDDDRVRRAQERGVLLPRLRAAPPRRGARGLPAAPHRALLRPGEGARRAVRPGERLGAAELLSRRRASTTTPRAASAAAAGGPTPSRRRRRSARTSA